MCIYVFIILQSTQGSLENCNIQRDKMYKLEHQNNVKNDQVYNYVFDKINMWNLCDSIILDALHEP